MDRRRLTGALALAGTALAWCFSRINAHGLWFDEAYTARIAALSPERVLRGALSDIHPPGWPLISALSLQLPLPSEVALRLPSSLAFAALVGWLGLRNPLLGLAALCTGPLLDQATQGRPYMMLAASLVACSVALSRGRWGAGGLLAGLACSLHALGGALVAPLLLCHILLARPAPRALARLFGGALVLTLWWAPAFIKNTLRYLQHPWYTPADAGAWWVVTDGWLGLAGIGLWLALQRRGAISRFIPGFGVLTGLALLELLGVGVEIRKVGVVVLPLLLAGQAAAPNDNAEIGWRGWAGLGALVLGLGLGSVRIDTRPDLREAANAVSALNAPVPVAAVFASEAAWYLRDPAPIAAHQGATDLRQRLGDLMAVQRSPCVCAISLPAGFAEEDALPAGTRTLAIAEVTGLDVRLVGSRDCVFEGASPVWRQAE